MDQLLIRSKRISKEVGTYCRGFRKTTLRMTLEQVSGEHSLKTLSAFENGKNNNLHHIFKYLHQCSSIEMRNYFISGLVELIEELTDNE